VCLEHERLPDAPARREHDLEEIRLLWERYRLAVSLARAADAEVIAEAERAEDPQPILTG
jgi:hypothetical protein